jgi:hypothetical protein
MFLAQHQDLVEEPMVDATRIMHPFNRNTPAEQFRNLHKAIGSWNCAHLKQFNICMGRKRRN